ncbi:MAG: ATP-binding protein [Saprospiraceae bacterium]|nr:ATP-binding protein [Saprospiraceae bacterium]
MKICKLIIQDYQQFKDLEIDLTYPKGHSKAGQPLDKVCFIGKNGAGKSTLLRIINSSLLLNQRKENCLTISNKHLSKHFISNSFDFQSYVDNGTHDILIHSISEGDSSYTSFDLPKTSLAEAQKLLDDQEKKNYQVNISEVTNFWNRLIYLENERQRVYTNLLTQEENQNKTVAQLNKEFNEQYPMILEGLAKLWDSILDEAGLKLDIENKKVPVHLNENLEVYIKNKYTDEQVKYNQLSTGIRNFIFRIGHIYALYFNRKVDNGFLLIDEPETSLSPNFMYDLVEKYCSIAKNSQVFMATHSSIIASQFEPCERIILKFDEQGHVTARKGSSPIGDDPNDLLRNDFDVKDLHGKKGLEAWNRYVKLHGLIKNTEDTEDKNNYIQEYLEIGKRYNFGSPQQGIS